MHAKSQPILYTEILSDSILYIVTHEVDQWVDESCEHLKNIRKHFNISKSFNNILLGIAFLATIKNCDAV